MDEWEWCEDIDGDLQHEPSREMAETLSLLRAIHASNTSAGWKASKMMDRLPCYIQCATQVILCEAEIGSLRLVNNVAVIYKTYFILEIFHEVENICLSYDRDLSPNHAPTLCHQP